MGLLNFVGKLLGLSGAPGQKIELTKSATAAGLPIIYGQRRVDAITVLKRVSNRRAANTGNANAIVVERGFDDRDDPLDNNNWLHRIDVWGQGPLEAITRFWIDGDADTHKRFASKRPYFRAVSLLGGVSQSALTGLSAAAPQWSSNHKGLGVAYSWTRFFNSTKFPQYRSEPRLRADIKGLRLYDPRQDPAYGGMGNQSFSDDSTWTYGNNRALVVLNYMMGSFGFGAPAGELDMDSFKAAADVCDETVSIPAVVTNQTGSAVPDWYDWHTGDRIRVDIDQQYPTYRPNQAGTSQARYEADAIIDPKRGVVENIRALLEEFGWSLSWSNGRHRLVIEDAVSGPVMTFDENTILGGWSVERGSRSERLNRVTVEFPNANKNFEEDTVSWPERGSSDYAAFLAEDGGRELHTNKSLTTVTDFYRAKAFAEFSVRRSRVGERIRDLKLAPEALLLEPGEVIALDLPEKGYSAPDNLFIVEKTGVSGTLDVSVDLMRYDPLVYGAEAPDNEPLGPNDDNADAWRDPSAINNLQAVEYHVQKADGSVISGIHATWDPPTSGVPVDHIEVKWRDNADTDFSGDDYQGTIILDSAAKACRIPDLVDNRLYRVVVSYVTRLRQRSIEAVVDPVDLTATTISKLDTIENGANRTEFRGAYSAITLYERGDIVTSGGSSYVFISTIGAIGTALTDPVYWEILAQVGADGAAGSDGGYFDIIFRRSASQPTTPSGDSPAGWSDGPPVANGNPLWMSKGLKSAADTLIGSWSSPREIGGLGLEIEYSVNGSAPWHTVFQTGDLYMRQRLTGGGWSAAQRIIGEKGDRGADGSDGTDGTDGADGASPIAYVGQVGLDAETGGSNLPTYISFYGYRNGTPNKAEAARVTLPDGTEFTWGGNIPSSGNDENAAAISNTTISGATEVYVVLDTTGSRRFTHSSSQANAHTAMAYKDNAGTWTYQKRGVGWASWPSSDLDSYIVIGAATKQASSPFNWLTFTPTILTLGGAPELGAVRISNTEHLANNAASLPKSYQGTSLLLNYEAQSYGTVGSAITGIPFDAGNGAAVQLAFSATFRCKDDPIKCYGRWQRRTAGGSWSTIRTMSQLLEMTDIGASTQRIPIGSEYTDTPPASDTYEYRLQAWGNGEQQISDRAYFDNFSLTVTAVRK